MFPSDTDFESEFTFEHSAVPLPDEPPFHVLVLGNWSGNSSRKELSARQPIVVDRDNFDDVLRGLNVEIDLNLSGDENNSLRLKFAELDDFHPDNLFRNVSLFSDLRDVRHRLSNPDTFESAANEVRSWFDAPEEDTFEAADIKSQIEDAPPIDSNNLLDMILAQPNDSSAVAKPQIVDNSELSRFISKIVSPYLIKVDENEQSKLISAVDETISDLMRLILHHPEFQALESSWRGLYFLVRHLETSADLKIFILDVSQADLSNNFKTVNKLTDSFIYRILKAESFAVIAGNYSFGVNVDDIATLMRISKPVAAFNTPFISYIKPEIFGIKDFSSVENIYDLNVLEDSNELKLWTALRSTPETGYIGLSPMRIIGRLPYGIATDTTETFSFEEFKKNIDINNLIWLNPCFVITLLLAQSYNLYGWKISSNLLRDVDNLPMCLYQSDGEMKTVSCAEAIITENMLEKILTQGLIPLISFRDKSNIRLARLQSVSSSAAELNGRWNY